jgi:hypothetical protein
VCGDSAHLHCCALVQQGCGAGSRLRLWLLQYIQGLAHMAYGCTCAPAGRRKVREVETGFKDTALHGSMPPAAAAAAVQDSNPAGAELCMSNPDDAGQQQMQEQPQQE